MRKCCDEVKVVKEDECVTEAKNAFLSVALIVGILTIIVGICVAVYKYLKRRRMRNRSKERVSLCCIDRWYSDNHRWYLCSSLQVSDTGLLRRLR